MNSLSITTEGMLMRGVYSTLNIGTLGLLWTAIAGTIWRRAFLFFSSRKPDITFTQPYYE